MLWASSHLPNDFLIYDFTWWFSHLCVVGKRPVASPHTVDWKAELLTQGKGISQPPLSLHLLPPQLSRPHPQESKRGLLCILLHGLAIKSIVGTETSLFLPGSISCGSALCHLGKWFNPWELFLKETTHSKKQKHQPAFGESKLKS